MNALTASNIVFAWEAGQGKHALDRALLLLSLAFPTQSVDALSTLTIGQRTRYLLTVRKDTLGPQASCVATCPHCNEKLEFLLNLEALLRSVSAVSAAESALALTVDAFTLQFRLPTSVDLAAVINSADLSTGRALLLERCLLHAEQAGQDISVTDLPEKVVTAIAEAMTEADPLAEIPLALNCIACGENWTSNFDIVSFFWAELEAQARRLFYDVHALASTYGWREADILAMSTTRRQLYLALIGS
jgi:T4 bacteriophage base plate protein